MRRSTTTSTRPKALAAAFEYVRDTNTAMDAGEFRAGNAAPALDFLARFDALFDVIRPAAGQAPAFRTPTSKPRSASAYRRANRAISPAATRCARNCSTLGVVLEDTKEGTRWKRK